MQAILLNAFYINNINYFTNITLMCCICNILYNMLYKFFLYEK